MDLSEESSVEPSKRSKLDFMRWGNTQVCSFVEEHNFDAEIVAKFAFHQIVGADLPSLTEKHLVEWDIGVTGVRLALLRLLQPFRTSAPVIPFFQTLDQFKVFNDPIHGHIELHPLCVKIIDTPQFQRLRYIKQLGAVYYVFPGGCHNRFEHSIGVCYLAGKLTRALQSRQPELGITEEDILCVEIAGLCHDLGHGPFSHMFDGKFIPLARPTINWRHEDASVQMFDFLIASNDLKREFEAHNLTERDLDFIKEQIAGPSQHMREKDWKYVGRDADRGFLYEIVANKRNGIDVDKWDYFARDCHYLGINNNFDHLRFMKFARVLKVEGQLQICSRDKEVGNLYDMFHTRCSLHRRAYQHKNKLLIEHMITEAFLKADSAILTPGKDGKLLKISETIDDMEAYARTDDSLFHRILHSTDDRVAEARHILEKIHRRELYKCVGQTKPTHDVVIKKDEVKKIAEEIVSAIPECELNGIKLTTDDIVVHLVNYDYGKKEKNPIDDVRFYRKGQTSIAIRVRKEQVSKMLPVTFSEQELRLYLKKRDASYMEVAAQCFQVWCSQHDMMAPKEGDVSPLELTPLKLSASDASHNEGLVSMVTPNNENRTSRSKINFT